MLRAWQCVAALLLLSSACLGVSAADDTQQEGTKQDDWSGCDPRSVYEILLDQSNDFATGIAGVVGPAFKGSVFVPTKTAQDVGELVVTLPGVLFDLVYLGSNGALDLAVQPKFSEANLRNLYQYHVVPELAKHEVEWVQLKEGAKTNGLPKTLADYEPYDKQGNKVELPAQEVDQYEVVRRSAVDDMQWDVSSMYGVKEAPFFVKSELLVHEYDQAICKDQSKTILRSGNRDNINYWKSKSSSIVGATEAKDKMIADGIKTGEMHNSLKDAEGITNMPPVGVLKVKVDYSVSPPKVTAVSGDGLPVMMPVKDAIRSCQGGAVYLVDILLLPCPFTDTTFTDDATGGLLAGVIIEAIAIVVLAVVVIILITLTAGIAVRGNFWLYPILFNTVGATILRQVFKGRPAKGIMEGLNLFLAAFGGIAGLPPFNNALAAQSFRTLQLRPGLFTSAIDAVNRWSTLLFGFNGVGTIMKSLLGI